MEKNVLEGKKWVVGVSGGADSMALLHMCIKHRIDIIVAHVNYQKRESAKRDMEGVISFCEAMQVPCFVMCVEQYEKKENFQQQARTIRYEFYRKCAIENQCEGVLVAHHKDDVIETYLMQKEAKRIPAYYGMKEEVNVYNIRVLRPLLQYTKEALEQYCIANHIPYYQDESNLSDVYTRNRIRHHIVEKMNDEKKDACIKEIEKQNEELRKCRKEAQSILENQQEYLSLHSFAALSKQQQIEVLRMYICAKTNYYTIRKSALEEILKILLHHKKRNVRHTINDVYEIVVEYGNIFIEEKQREEGFSYRFEDVQYIKTPYFTIAQEGKVIEGVNLTKEDFPICIRNARKEDEIHLRFGRKKVRRFFIDRKIPSAQRKVWPIIENAKKEVIFVCGIGCDINHYSNNSTFFVLK